MILQAFSLSIHSATKTVLKIAGIYRWSIILADTDFFQQSVSVSAADFKGRNNRPSAKHFGILCTYLAESLIKKCLADGRLFLPLKSAADTDC